MIWKGLYFFEYREIKPVDKPYLNRWILFECQWFGVYVHKFLDSDPDGALHDHPWDFISIILKGQYIEYLGMDYAGKPTRSILRRAGSFAFRRAASRHRVQLFEKDWNASFFAWRTVLKPVWTLMLVSGRKRPKWGFWPGGTWCWWRSYNQKNGICESEVLYTYGKD